MDGEDEIKDDQLDAGEGKNNDPCRLHGAGLCEGRRLSRSGDVGILTC